MWDACRAERPPGPVVKNPRRAVTDGGRRRGICSKGHDGAVTPAAAAYLPGEKGAGRTRSLRPTPTPAGGLEFPGCQMGTQAPRAPTVIGPPSVPPEEKGRRSARSKGPADPRHDYAEGRRLPRAAVAEGINERGQVAKGRLNGTASGKSHRPPSYRSGPAFAPLDMFSEATAPDIWAKGGRPLRHRAWIAQKGLACSGTRPRRCSPTSAKRSEGPSSRNGERTSFAGSSRSGAVEHPGSTVRRQACPGPRPTLQIGPLRRA